MASTISAGTTAGTAVAITGDTSGNLALLTQNGANTITVPNGTGTMAVQGVSSNIVSGTAVASTSGTSIDFTSIPSWVKRITVMFNQVSTNGTSNPLIQLGSGSAQTSGYLASATLIGSANTAYTNGFGLPSAAAVNIIYGHMVFTLLGSNLWTGSICMALNQSGTTYGLEGAGNVTLSGTLDRVRITTVNGTDTFDAGSINILYE